MEVKISVNLDYIVIASPPVLVSALFYFGYQVNVRQLFLPDSLPMWLFTAMFFFGVALWVWAIVRNISVERELSDPIGKLVLKTHNFTVSDAHPFTLVFVSSLFCSALQKEPPTDLSDTLKIIGMGLILLFFALYLMRDRNRSVQQMYDDNRFLRDKYAQEAPVGMSEQDFVVRLVEACDAIIKARQIKGWQFWRSDFVSAQAMYSAADLNHRSESSE